MNYLPKLDFYVSQSKLIKFAKLLAMDRLEVELWESLKLLCQHGFGAQHFLRAKPGRISLVVEFSLVNAVEV